MRKGAIIDSHEEIGYGPKDIGYRVKDIGGRMQGGTDINQNDSQSGLKLIKMMIYSSCEGVALLCRGYSVCYSWDLIVSFTSGAGD